MIAVLILCTINYVLPHIMTQDIVHFTKPLHKNDIYNTVLIKLLHKNTCYYIINSMT